MGNKTEYQTYRMVWVGRVVKDHLVSTFLPFLGKPSIRPDSLKPIQPGLEHLRDEASTASLGNLILFFTTLTVKKYQPLVPLKNTDVFISLFLVSCTLYFICFL